MISNSLSLLCGAVLSSSVLAASSVSVAGLPEPPIPPAITPLDDAPIPHKDSMLPVVIVDQDVKVTAENFRYESRSRDPAAGFVPGSKYENSTEQKGIQTLGLLVRVPLKPVK